ncbi:GntR family transcriptional regulator [Lactobacillus amylovorus]|jgi:GntR family transcriptional regulator|uniref:GntR family transcriptional regulator n=1 Tax=Lactobacillus amylovorus TaxID=1604 RepID=UPI001CCB67E1|nr:GntR family transcriptional regulator [Lactobacillus amylovorus]UIK35472.1 GntR family transcriptional regulator [Lactobacillus amylovorus]UNL46574.1 GntR family transcriptional regulator [Lactobacillus amylovorus]GMM16890.1 GntR family transcriptional regulator [Lactobacillus amylovorus]GMM21191.1 GntR family transcriptional regulator [Lactobacillus amylovorus]
MTKAKYQEIEEILRQRIISGHYKIGDLIPKEMDLVKKYNVSRPTISHAVQDLVNQGYLERRKHVGTIVKQTKISQEFTQVLQSYNSEMTEKGLTAQTQVLFFKKVLASEEVAQALDLKEKEQVYKLTRLRSVDQNPLVVVTTYLSADKLVDFAKIDFTKQSLYQELEQRGLPIVHVKRKLEVKSADGMTADLLNIKEKDPVFYFHTYGYSKNELPLEYSIATYRGDENYFMIDLKK